MPEDFLLYGLVPAVVESSHLCHHNPVDVRVESVGWTYFFVLFHFLYRLSGLFKIGIIEQICMRSAMHRVARDYASMMGSGQRLSNLQ